MIKKIKKLKIVWISILSVFYLNVTGCGLVSQKPVTEPVLPQGASIEPITQPQFAGPHSAEGSLWISNNSSMFEDSKATRVGDTVIVDIIENTSSKIDVNTEGTRNTKMDIGVPKLNFLGKETNFGAAAGATQLIGTNFSNTFAGEGKSDRSGQITASIAARITEVMPNGNLTLFGRRAMKVNSEVQFITVAGIVRPQDISASNRVKSTYLADSRIEYYGKGALANKQKPGWGTNLIETIWPW